MQYGGKDASKRAAKALAVNCAVLPYFLKQLLFFAFSDMLIVVWDLSVGAILPCVILDKSLVKKFMVHRLDILPAVCYIQVGTLWIGILGVKLPAVMIDRATPHHDADRPFQINPSFLFRRASGGPLLLSAKVTQKHF